jgi:hypothetical protein
MTLLHILGTSLDYARESAPKRIQAFFIAIIMATSYAPAAKPAATKST